MNHFRLNLVAVLAFAALVSLPLTGLAAMHGHGGSGGMGATDHKMDDHGGMKMDAATVMLGDQAVEGVRAMAHLKDVKTAMAKMGMKETHHFMVNFLGRDGKPVTEGTVAVKIKDPAGVESAPIQLSGMDGHFGADIVLSARGAYEFRVGTRLPDGATRQYVFTYEIK